MIRPGQIHILNVINDQYFGIASYNYNLYISGHHASELGDYIYIIGGYVAPSIEGDVEPARSITRLHIPSLKNGEVCIESHDISTEFSEHVWVLRR